MSWSRLVVIGALGTALAACGGGSGGGGASADTPAQAGTARTVEGVAAKGLIKNGIVNIYSYDANGIRSASPVGSTTTGQDGTYSFNIGNRTGLFTVEVSAAAGTTMADEFSGDIPMPSGMTMRGILQIDGTSGIVIPGNVTPLTEMLVAAAVNAPGGLTSNNIASVQAGVITMLGFNPLTTKPINVNSVAAAATTDPAEKLQSVTLAALSQLASQSTNELGCTGSSSAKVACIVSATVTSTKLENNTLSVAAPVQSAIQAALETVVADKTINKTTLGTLDGQVTFSKPAVSTVTAVSAPVAAAKGLFASLRNNIGTWTSSGTASSLDTRLDAIEDDFNAAISPVDQELADWMLLAERGVVIYRNYADGGNQGAPVETVRVAGHEIGKCYLYADAAATVPVSAGVALNNVFCFMIKTVQPGSETAQFHAMPGTGWKQNTSTTLTAQTLAKTIQLKASNGARTMFTYVSQSRVDKSFYNRDTAGNMVDYYIDSPGAGALQSVGQIGSGSIVANQAALPGLTIAGDMPARTTPIGGVVTDKETWNISFTRALEKDGLTVNYALSGDITALRKNKAGVLAKVGTIGLQSGSYVRVAAGDNGLKEVNLLLSVANDNSKLVGTLALSNFSFNRAALNYAPTTLKFGGSLSNAGSELFKGTFSVRTLNYAQFDDRLPISSSNFLSGNVAFTGVLRVPNRPDLTLSLSAANPDPATRVYTGQYDDGTNTILFNSSNAKPRLLNISSANGISLQLQEGASTATVMRNSNKVATLDLAKGMINYTDGSFESIK